MTFRSSTIANASNRRRFVTAELAQPYLNDRRRKNELRAARQVEGLIRNLVQTSRYGTANRLDRALRLRDAAAQLLAAEERLAAVPPAGEPRQHDLDVYRLAAD